MSEGNSNNQWFVWLVVISVVVVTLIAFNYSSQNAQMSDIFTDDELGEVPIEYEFVDAKAPVPADAPAPQVVVEKVSAPAPQQVVRASAPAPQAVVPTATSTTAQMIKSSGSFAIQVLASKDKDRLEIDLKTAKDKGFPSYIYTKQLNSGTWHRLYIGPFEQKAQANELLPKVQQVYKDGFIIVVK